jgi:hypothetical protein
MASHDLYYRSIDDLDRLVRDAATRLPGDIDLVVGIPRSGLLVASLLALHMHLPMATLPGFMRGEILHVGRRLARRSQTPRKVLVVDDSVSSGAQLRVARDALTGMDVPLLFGVAYSTPEALALVDFAFEVLPQPRVFEWNILNGETLRTSCVDLDALEAEASAWDAVAGSDGRDRIGRHFHYPIGHITSTRGEADRGAIEAFLRRRGVSWGRLWLAGEATGSGDDHRATAYRDSGALLFIAHDRAVARSVAEKAQRPVFSTETMQLIYPGREAGAVMTFSGHRPAQLSVPLTWFVRQAAVELTHRIAARHPRLRHMRRVFGH